MDLTILMNTKTGSTDLSGENDHIEQTRAEQLRPKYHNSVLLEPKPSDDPHDPLNFSTWQKLSLLAVLSYWAFLGTTNLIIVVCFLRDQGFVRENVPGAVLTVIRVLLSSS